MKIAIITDGNNTLGMGHVYQSITLANLLKTNTQADILFVTKSDQKVVDLICESNFPVFFHPNDESIFNFLESRNLDKIIFDKLDVPPDLAKKIKEGINAKLIIFTNLTEANKYADVTVMAGMGSDFKNIYSKNTDRGRVEFWGPKYWLLRPEFYAIRPSKSKPVDIKNIMLIFGGADRANLSTAVLKELLEMETAAFVITIILGAAFMNRTELNDVKNAHSSSKSKVIIIDGLKDVAGTMYQNDLVFASPGLSFFEALAVGTAVLCFHQNDFQRDAWKSHIPTLGKQDVYKVPSLINEQAFIFPKDEFIRVMEVGQGREEIIREIIN